ncbi:MAG: UTP--glucose-1-phosphate uridylyltransferase GalU [Acidimicrobiales bacterium]
MQRQEFSNDEDQKAVIPAAGLGTRFLPFSKAVPKEMLPIVDRPVIQYVIQEALDSGIDDILIITSRHKKVMEDHFDRHTELEQLLEGKGKTAEAEELRELSTMANIHFVRQGEALGLGHAIGVARHHIGNEPFVVLLGDDIMSSSVLQGMVRAYEQHHCSVVGLMEVSKDDISSYGCAGASEIGPNLVEVSELVEKPAVEDAPSNLAIMGRYLFTPEIFDEIDNTPPGVGGEIQITDAMTRLMAHQRMLGVTFTEGRYDTGKKIDYLRAVVDFALQRPDLGPAFREILVDVVTREGLI